MVVVVEDSHEMNAVSIHPKPLSPNPHLSTILEGTGGTLRKHTHLHRSLVGHADELNSNTVDSLSRQRCDAEEVEEESRKEEEVKKKKEILEAAAVAAGVGEMG